MTEGRLKAAMTRLQGGTGEDGAPTTAGPNGAAPTPPSFREAYTRTRRLFGLGICQTPVPAPSSRYPDSFLPADYCLLDASLAAIPEPSEAASADP